MESSLQEYLRNRRPIYVINDKSKNIVYDPAKLPEANKNVIIIAPLNTDLSGWDKMVKKNYTFSSIPQ